MCPPSKRKLVEHADEAVEPILAAIAGAHGRLHPDRRRDSVHDLMDVLERIAEDNVSPLAEALAHDVPAVNAAVWALGHSKSRHARAILKDLLDHEDSAIRSMAEFHLCADTERGSGTRRRKTKRKKTAKKKAAKKKKVVKRKAKKKATKKKATRKVAKKTTRKKSAKKTTRKKTTKKAARKKR